MEGKAMKKKIILFLSFLVIAMCLTGCSTKVTREKIEEMTEIAQNIKDTPNYELPEGYTYNNVDNRKNDGRIIISTGCEHNKEDTLCITFDISQEKVKYTEIKASYNSELVLTTIIFIIICIIIGIASYSVGKKS